MKTTTVTQMRMVGMQLTRTRIFRMMILTRLNLMDQEGVGNIKKRSPLVKVLVLRTAMINSTRTVHTQRKEISSNLV